MEIIKPSDPSTLAGRIIALNLSKCKRFSCGNFSLSAYSPMAVVSEKASMEQIQQGLLDGRLIDVTDQDKAGLKMGETQHAPARELGDTGKRVFIGSDTRGNLFVVTPKDKEEEQKFLQEIEETGTLRLDYAQAMDETSLGQPQVKDLVVLTDPE